MDATCENVAEGGIRKNRFDFVTVELFKIISADPGFEKIFKIRK